MAWGEVHILTGVMIQQAAEGRWWLALPLAIMSHWPLDDLNIGSVARVYHGLGKGWRRVLTTVARVPIIAAICYIFWVEPVLMICGLTAWLVFDHEWIVGGYGLHRRMWPEWLKGEWGMVPKFIGMSLLAVMLIL